LRTARRRCPSTVILLLLWFYLTSIAILVGAEVNAELEH
jgi:uncharacterized BrkB/YihY/UPF0761 family membrane protein